MARERIIVKEALNALKSLLNEILKRIPDDFSHEEPENIAFSANILAFSVRFLHEISKIQEIILDLTKRLENLGSIIISQLSLRANKTNNFCEEIYFLHIYPLSRILEALAGAYSFNNHNACENSLVTRIVELIFGIVSSGKIYNLIEDNQKFVPVVRGLTNIAKRLNNKNIVSMIDQILEKILDIAVEEDPELTSIYTQDIFYLVKLQKNEGLTSKELKPLYENTNSFIFKKVLKGVEYLSIFGIEPPLTSVDFILSKMPLFFNEVFRVGDPENLFVYYSSIAESMNNILNYYNNKAFAQAMMNHLIEDTGWISRNNYNTIDYVKTVIGTSLLIHARGAIRR